MWRKWKSADVFSISDIKERFEVLNKGKNKNIEVVKVGKECIGWLPKLIE